MAIKELESLCGGQGLLHRGRRALYHPGDVPQPRALLRHPAALLHLLRGQGGRASQPFPAGPGLDQSQLDALAGRVHLVSPLSQHGPAEELGHGAPGRNIQNTVLRNSRLFRAGRPLLPGPPSKWGCKRSQTWSDRSCRRCVAAIPPPHTFTRFTAIYHHLLILTTPPKRIALQPGGPRKALRTGHPNDNVGGNMTAS